MSDDSVTTLSTNYDLPATLLHADDVRPQSFGHRRPSSRLQAYRRQRKRRARRRNRRIAALLAIIAAIISLGLAYKAHHPEFTFQQYFSVEDLNVTTLDILFENAANNSRQAISSLAQRFTTRENPEEIITKKRDNTDIQRKEIPDKRPVETIEKHEPEITREKPNPEPEPQPQPEPPHMSTNSVVPIQPKKKDERPPEDQTKEDATLQRPAFCNIPLSYAVHPKCRRLATQNPIFNLQGLVQDMMQ